MTLASKHTRTHIHSFHCLECHCCTVTNMHIAHARTHASSSYSSICHSLSLTNPGSLVIVVCSHIVSILKSIRWQWAVYMLIYWTCWNVINRKIITRDIFLDMWRNQRWFMAFFQCICRSKCSHIHWLTHSIVRLHARSLGPLTAVYTRQLDTSISISCWNVCVLDAFLTCMQSPINERLSFAYANTNNITYIFGVYFTFAVPFLASFSRVFHVNSIR